MLNTHGARRKVILYFTPASAATVESLVTDVRYTVLIHFPNIAQCSKRMHYFHRVVGLVVNICHCQDVFTDLCYVRPYHFTELEPCGIERKCHFLSEEEKDFRKDSKIRCMGG